MRAYMGSVVICDNDSQPYPPEHHRLVSDRRHAAHEKGIHKREIP